MTRRYHAGFASVVVFAFGGCTGGYPGWELDYVAKSIDKYGTVSISGATLIEPDPRFQLDLELTGREIFERNRIEGSAAIRQFDAADVQISVKAEIIANLMDQMQGTTDPKLLQKLRTNLMAAAFQGLADGLPENLQPFAEALRGSLPAEKEPNGEDDENDETPSEPEDGGLLTAADAKAKATEVNDQVKVAEDSATSANDAATEDDDIPGLVAAAVTASEAAIKAAGELATLIESAAEQAKTLALKVRGVAAGDLAKFGPARTEADAALEAAAAAKAEAQALRTRIAVAQEKFDAIEPSDDKDKAKANARAANKITATIGSDISAIIILLSLCCLCVPHRYHPRLPERKALGLYTGILLSITASQFREPHRPRPWSGSN